MIDANNSLHTIPRWVRWCLALVFVLVNIAFAFKLSGFHWITFPVDIKMDIAPNLRAIEISQVVKESSLAKNVSEKKHDATNSKLTVLPIFPLLTDPSYNMSHYGTNIPTREQLEQRMTDFLESTEYSLYHEHVAKVILLYSQDAMPEYIIKHLGNHPKLSFQRVSSTYTVTTIFEYVHEKLQDELILITNGDVYPAEGFEHVQYGRMKNKRLFYAPTRHGKAEKRCKMGAQNCDKGGNYWQAHDSYIFIPSGSFHEKAKTLMNKMLWDDYGMEHVILYAYRNYMRYTVFNPCLVIFMYHNHCSNLRHSVRPRFGNGKIYFDVGPSTQLQ